MGGTLRAVDGELEAEVDAVLSAAAAVALDAYGAVLPMVVGDVVRRGALPPSPSLGTHGIWRT